MKVENIDQLRSLYDQPNERAQKKQLASLDKHAINFIERSPFVIISTCDKNGRLDTSPRGGKPGFVKIKNNQELIIPDSKGNNRIDSLSNIVETGRFGSLFLIPGVDETMRINGKAHISTSSELIEMFPSEQNTPKTCIVISVEEVFIHCAKAFMRSKLWHTDSQINRKELPTIGQILNDQIGSNEKTETHEEMIKRYQGDL